jgi:hypothetical protein
VTWRTLVGLFLICLATIMDEILLTRIFSVTMWCHFAFGAHFPGHAAVPVLGTIPSRNPTFFILTAVQNWALDRGKACPWDGDIMAAYCECISIPGGVPTAEDLLRYLRPRSMTEHDWRVYLPRD